MSARISRAQALRRLEAIERALEGVDGPITLELIAEARAALARAIEYEVANPEPAGDIEPWPYGADDPRTRLREALEAACEEDAQAASFGERPL